MFYIALKFQGYFESLRNEIRGRNIAITMICPGPVFSDVLKNAFTSQKGEVITLDTFQRII